LTDFPPFSQFLDALTAKFGNETALEEPGRRFTFYEVDKYVRVLVNELRADGVGPTDVVGISVRDEINHFLLTLSLMFLGATQIVLATHDSELMKKQLIERAKVTRVIDEKALNRILKLCRSSPEFSHKSESESTGGTIILKTSGTVARAKLVPFTPKALFLQARQHEFYEGSRFLRHASVEHNNSKRHRLYCYFQGGTNLFRGATQVTLGRRYLVDSGCSRFDIARSHFASILDDSSRIQIAADIALTVAGSPLEKDLRQRFQREVSPNLFVRYGSTETGTIAIAGPEDHDLEGCVGRPLTGVQIKTDAGQSSPTHERAGLLKIRTPGMASSYFDEKSEIELRFSDGWFLTDDIGAFSQDGLLRIIGRESEAFTLDGVNVYPREIEGVMLGHSEIRYVAVVRKDSEHHHGIPIAFVVPRNLSKFDEIALLTWARTEMGLAAPRQIISLSEIPMTASGKVDYRALQELLP
jgi:long-chain acyl-CoA synthetase